MRKLGGWRAVGSKTAGLAACALAGIMLAAPAGAAFAAVPVGAPLAAQPAWKIQNSPNATVPGGQLHSVSCSAASACAAVGTNVSPSGLTIPLIERWNGKSWTQQRSANPSDSVPASLPDLLGVSCPGADFCAAVGSYQVGVAGISWAESWNGRAWTTQSVPMLPGWTSSGLDKVSCASARFCEAVGSYRNGVGATLGFAARWNGTSWRVQRTPDPAMSTLAGLAAVSCVSPTFCEADGGAEGVGAFAMRWNGNSWHLQVVPGTAGAGPLSCVSPTFCEIVGAGGDVWNGSSWSAQPIANPAGSTSAGLTGLSCVTTAFCEAVGQYTDSSGRYFSLAAAWNGSSWSLQPIPSPARAGAAFMRFDAVSCAAMTACEAGGEFQVSSSTSNLIAVAESWNRGSWRIQPGAAPPAPADNVLNAVSCVSAVFCEAAGSHPDATDVNTIALAEMWNGNTWKIQRTANPAQARNGVRLELAGVSCVSAHFCEAVGSSSSSAGGGAEVWDGTSWALQAIPGASLTAVSCTSAQFCMAAGADGHVAIWTGSSWTAQATAPGFSSLSSVSCMSPRSCEAVGSGPAGDDAERWNGTSWTPQATPAPAGGTNVGLSAVSCAGPRACEAVGGYTNATFQGVTLAETWNGTSWSVRSTPNPAGAAVSSLRGISCTSANFCAAVGQYIASATYFTLAEVWNGTRWTLRRTANVPNAFQDALNGVSCGVGRPCTAVGVTAQPSQASATLIETGA